MVTSHQKYLCYTRIIQTNETTWILGACRVVKSTFEIIVHFLKEKVGIQNLSFLRSILQCKQILTVHKARVMFYASEKVEQSSLNGLNSFRTCLIALVEYAMVSAFFIFCFIWREFTLLTDDGSAIYVHSREPIRQRHQKPWGQFFLYTQNIYIAEPGIFLIRRFRQILTKNSSRWSTNTTRVWMQNLHF